MHCTRLYPPPETVLELSFSHRPLLLVPSQCIRPMVPSRLVIGQAVTPRPRCDPLPTIPPSWLWGPPLPMPWCYPPFTAKEALSRPNGLGGRTEQSRGRRRSTSKHLPTPPAVSAQRGSPVTITSNATRGRLSQFKPRALVRWFNHLHLRAVSPSNLYCPCLVWAHRHVQER